MEKVENTKLDLSKIKELAAKASPVAMMLTFPLRGKPMSKLVGIHNQVLAQGMQVQDAQFHLTAREAVLSMADELQQLREYAEYVSGVITFAEIMLGNGIRERMLPMTYEEWLQLRAAGVVEP